MLAEQDIYTILDEALQRTQKGGQRQDKFNPDLQLFGINGIFDSLDAMIFLDCVDDLLTIKTGKPFSLMTDDVFAAEDSPFATMRTLSAYIAKMLNA